ncbi:MAG: hypothetical protein FWH54_00525 [Methanobrevibacter sp.]|nr:hypothetical protein [Methanobrevibacter sp.]
MSYSSIKNHFQSIPYDKKCVPINCKEKSKGKCELKGITSEYIVLKADEIETIDASFEKRDQEKAVDCIIFKKEYMQERKIVLIIELKAKKDYSQDEILIKFKNSALRLKKIFKKFNLKLKDHQINFVLLSKYKKKVRYSQRKRKNKKGKEEKVNSFKFDGKDKIIINKKCDILIEDVWY